MAATVFIGDELTAAGFRLAGVEILTPDVAEVSAAFSQARDRAGLVIVASEFAQMLAPADLDAALTAETPVVAVITDILGRIEPPDVSKRLRSALGIET